MALTYPLALPTPDIRNSIKFTARSAVAMNVSPFTGEQQVYAHQGEWWECEFNLASRKRDVAEAWVGFLLALNGMEGTFNMGDPANTTPQGVATGSPLVAGASQFGKTLSTDGWTPSVTGILKAGDWIQLGSGSGAHLHKVVQDANSDGAGASDIEIWPRLRQSPGDNDPITITSTQGLWRLASNQRQWDIDLALTYGIALRCVEVL